MSCLTDCFPGKLKHLLGRKPKSQWDLAREAPELQGCSAYGVFNLPKSSAAASTAQRTMLHVHPEVGLASVRVGLIDILNKCTNLAKG